MLAELGSSHVQEVKIAILQRTMLCGTKLKNFQFTNWSKDLIVTHLKQQKSLGSLI